MLWFGRTQFFPPVPRDLSQVAEMCIGTKSRALGDALALTTLPAKLKRAYPGLKVSVYAKAFNPVVFRGCPEISGTRRNPGAVFGDDTNLGTGQLIQQKERAFGLPVSDDPRPVLYLNSSERIWAEGMLREKVLPGNEAKPLCVIHPWGGTRNKVLRVEDWDALVKRWNHRYRFWQVGLEGQGAVQGCEYYLLTAPSRWQVRRIFALIERASAFVGVDSGPMHVARAFGIRSLIYVSHLSPEERDLEAVFSRRKQGDPYFLHGNWRYSPLYDANRHIAVDRHPPEQIARDTDAFFELS